MKLRESPSGQELLPTQPSHNETISSYAKLGIRPNLAEQNSDYITSRQEQGLQPVEISNELAEHVIKEEFCNLGYTFADRDSMGGPDIPMDLVGRLSIIDGPIPVLSYSHTGWDAHIVQEDLKM